MRGNVTIFEGPDAVGKSTALIDYASYLSETGRTASHIMRNGPYLELDARRLFTTYLAQLNLAYGSGAAAHVYLDRAWQSELIYGPVCRGSSRLTSAHVRMLTRAALGASTVIVLCRVNWVSAAKVWKRRKARGEEYVGTPAWYRKVYTGYIDLEVCLRAESLRFFTPPLLPTVTFNWEHDSLEELRKSIEEVRPLPNEGPGSGNWNPGKSILMVGDRPSPSGGRVRYPFIASSASGCSAWLADQLDELAVPERDLYWVNAFDHAGNPTDPAFIEHLKPKRIVALGGNAAGWLEANGFADFTYQVPHPSSWKRFRYSQPYKPLKEVFSL